MKYESLRLKVFVSPAGGYLVSLLDICKPIITGQNWRYLGLCNTWTLDRHTYKHYKDRRQNMDKMKRTLTTVLLQLHQLKETIWVRVCTNHRLDRKCFRSLVILRSQGLTMNSCKEEVMPKVHTWLDDWTSSRQGDRCWIRRAQI